MVVHLGMCVCLSVRGRNQKGIAPIDLISGCHGSLLSLPARGWLLPAFDRQEQSLQRPAAETAVCVGWGLLHKKEYTRGSDLL